MPLTQSKISISVAFIVGNVADEEGGYEDT